MTGFDQPGVDGSDGDFVDALAVDGEERESATDRKTGRWSGVGAHRMPSFGPVRVADHPLWTGMADQLDS